ncbi:aminotransferase class V-fold PLP-dependent enzyme [Cognatishimia activa]|uniref:Putative cysteine desulfurase n=1 Tax=Cognatishimia activa TaxID=1715691 RepID=A0A0P1IQ26_9RHOB|nr:aminotransferase class V-fold PLP-dependent enzyme [Cognatishimia activa]CUI84449.1 putative cysteine desulfurase [Cognatishimia activa]CUK25702.1 putative cysteine desulfurase [Cognatishimia activa]
MLYPETAFANFDNMLQCLEDPIAELRSGLIGANVRIDTPTGQKKMIYADYVASGRALRQIEDFVLEEVLPYYANSHTEQSLCGARMTRMREEARGLIARHCNANANEHAVIFGGSGATTGLNQAIHLFGIHAAVAAGRPVHVLVGPYEHHSNLLPWRESGAEVIEIAEATEGGVDLDDLISVLAEIADKDSLIIGAFSAASNVTGVCTDPAPISRLIKAHGGRVLWDYAGGAPYLPMSMSPDGINIDAIVFSPHKFIGGPGASGILIIRRDAVTTMQPSRPGGGTVAFVNERQHDYVDRLEQREEGGTPNVVGDIRAALAVLVKESIGQTQITSINQRLSAFGFRAANSLPGMDMLAPARTDRLPIFSFVPRDKKGQRLDYRHFTQQLSESYGIQARGGCSCAGPYVHSLLGISDIQSEQLRDALLNGDEEGKPGFVRFNLSYLMDDATIDAIFSGIGALLEESAGIGCG